MGSDIFTNENLAWVILAVLYTYMIKRIAFQIYHDLNLIKNGMIKSVRLLGYEYKKGVEGDWSLFPLVALNNDYKFLIYNRVHSNKKEFKEGDEIMIYFDELNPERSIVKGSFGGLPLLIPFLVFLLLLPFFIYFVVIS